MGMLSLVKSVPSAFAKAVGKTAFKLNKNKPQIMVIGGIAIATSAFVLAIVNATKMKDEMSVIESKKDDIQLRKDEAQNESNQLSEEESKAIITVCNKELRQTQKEAAWLIFKLIVVPSLMFIGGISLTVGGHLILLRRFGELSSSFAMLQQTFERYRQWNIAEHGEECDRRYRYGIVGETDAEVSITDENGKEKKVQCKVPVVDNDKAASMYRFVFSEEFSRRCPKDPVSTISFLRSQEKYWNMWMESTGQPVTLYMVLEELGIKLDPDDPMNDYIMIAGWRPNGEGDNHIDFGIMRAENRPAISMQENVVWLNFNCDGNLYHSTRYTKDGRRVC